MHLTWLSKAKKLGLRGVIMPWHPLMNDQAFPSFLDLSPHILHGTKRILGSCPSQQLPHISLSTAIPDLQCYVVQYLLPLNGMLQTIYTFAVGTHFLIHLPETSSRKMLFKFMNQSKTCVCVCPLSWQHAVSMEDFFSSHLFCQWCLSLKWALFSFCHSL